jgi:hypothetical protein
MVGNNFKPTITVLSRESLFRIKGGPFSYFFFILFYLYVPIFHIVQAALFAIDKLEKGVGLKEPVVRLFQPAGQFYYHHLNYKEVFWILKLPIFSILKTSVADPGCLSWILIFTHCSAQTQTRIGLLEEIPRSGFQSPCLYY